MKDAFWSTATGQFRATPQAEVERATRAIQAPI